ncbi:MAG: AAA family ATPase [Candidatus Bathyarchaeia archaeon]
MSVNMLIDDNPWWRPDVLRFLEELRRTRSPEQQEDPEKAIHQWRISLLNKLAELDPQLLQLKGTEVSLNLQRIWNPRLIFLLRKNILWDSQGSYVLISVRGPRQVGKTTMTKLLIGELLLEHLLHPHQFSPLKIVYIRCDNPRLGGPRDLSSVMRDFLRERVDYPGEPYLFLDEVSSLRDWQMAVKDLHDGGFLLRHKAKILVTGSHSLDVKKGAEILALRKGIMLEGGNDKLLLPMKFSEYVMYREQIVGKHAFHHLFTTERFLERERRIKVFSEIAQVGAPVPDIFKMAGMYIHELWVYFNDYLISGGYPPAIRQHLEKGMISPGVYSGYIDLAVKDAIKWNLNPDTLYNLIWQLLEGPRGSYDAAPIKEVSYNSLAGRMGVSHNTVKQYLDYLIEAFVLHEITKLKEIQKRRSPPKVPRKFYFWDPLMFYAFKASSSGAGDAYALALRQASRWRSVVAEMVTVVNVAHMLMSLEMIQDLVLLRRKMFYYKPMAGKEIDCIAEVEGKLVPIEIYSGEKVEGTHAEKLVKMSRQLNVRSILAYGGTELHISDELIAIPIPLFILLA